VKNRCSGTFTGAAAVAVVELDRRGLRRSYGTDRDKSGRESGRFDIVPHAGAFCEQ
jgi:hypothetical protein